jgi:hypothetical protein
VAVILTNPSGARLYGVLDEIKKDLPEEIFRHGKRGRGRSNIGDNTDSDVACDWTEQRDDILETFIQAESFDGFLFGTIKIEHLSYDSGNSVDFLFDTSDIPV